MKQFTSLNVLKFSGVTCQLKKNILKVLNAFLQSDEINGLQLVQYITALSKKENIVIKKVYGSVNTGSK